MSDEPDNPMDHPPEQPTGTDRAPRFGRLLLLLASAVLLIAVLALAAEFLVS